MKLLIGMFFILFLAGQGKDFRHSAWGIDKEKVKVAEAKIKFLGEEENNLYYADTLFNQNVMIVFNFTDGKLTSGSYFFNEKQLIAEKAINLFEKIKSAYNRIYNKAVTDTVIVKSGNTPSNRDEFRVLFGKGEIELYSLWLNNNNEIFLTLKNQENKIKLGIVNRLKE